MSLNNIAPINDPPAAGESDPVPVALRPDGKALMMSRATYNEMLAMGATPHEIGVAATVRFLEQNAIRDN